jgi:iron complex transport system substrate-binding protein
MRIVSLIASATEIVCRLGFEQHLVGRSHECDYPESIKRLPACTRPRFDVEGTSQEIDQRVKAIVQDGLSVYHVDGEMLRELAPDVIVTQSQCEVCAVSLRDVERAVCAWMQRCPRLVSLAPNALADVWIDIENVADALGAPERGVELVTELRGRMEIITRLASKAISRPRVGCIEWLDPLMAAGNWVPELVQMAGGINVFGTAGEHAPWMTWDELCQSDPDLLVLLPCGLDIPRCRQDVPLLSSRPEWPRLRAVKASRVFVTDGNQYFNRPGPRLLESLEVLTELFHPELGTFGHEGTAWQRL